MQLPQQLLHLIPMFYNSSTNIDRQQLLLLHPQGPLAKVIHLNTSFMVCVNLAVPRTS
jgi:hypothetical protein